MKGIAHFLTGVALATCFPAVVERAAAGSLLPVLGGICGLLPDTLDFKFARYFERYDDEIDPGPAPDAEAIAQRMAAAMRRAYHGAPQHVMLHTIRLGADLWRQYAVRFYPTRGEIGVRVGPLVNTGQVPLPGSVPEDAGEARAEIGVPLVHTYDAEMRVDIFSGPSFKFERQGERLRVHFLDWHRRWSHSLTLAAALGAGVAGLAALGELVSRGALSRLPLWAGLVAGLGFAGHVVEDQLGFMGSNLLYPLTRRRTPGLRLIRSGHVLPNFLTVWVAVVGLVFNLDRFSPQPSLNPGRFLGLGVALPALLMGAWYHRQRRREAPRPAEALRQGEMVEEAEGN
jgi:membrane-bound metal-dependent hydrolase YbcI (DUF457 family)